MKKIFAMVAVAAGLLFAGNANAQLGIHLGYSPETWTTGDNSSDIKGIFAGVDYNMPLAGALNLNLGGQVRYNSKSSSTTVGSGSLSQTTKIDKTQILLDVPVLLNYGFNLTGDLKLSVFAGATVSYAFVGQTKTTLSGLINSEGDPSSWYGDNGSYNPLNLSGTFGLCFSYQQFRLFGGYNMGLMDIDKNDNTTTKTSGLFFGLGMAL